MLSGTRGTNERPIGNVRMRTLCLGTVHTIPVEGVKQKLIQEGCHLSRLLIFFHLFSKYYNKMFHKTLKSSAFSDFKFKGSEPIQPSMLGSTHASTLESNFSTNKT
jgi:hypothetical protein